MSIPQIKEQTTTHGLQCVNHWLQYGSQYSRWLAGRYIGTFSAGNCEDVVIFAQFYLVCANSKTVSRGREVQS